MRRSCSTKFILFATALTFALLVPRPGFAEMFIAVYGGIAYTGDDTVTVQEHEPFFVPPNTFRLDADFDQSSVFGGRIGYWFRGAPWLGVALDVSHHEAEADNLDVDAVPVSGLIMLRAPLHASDAYPRGRLQPYLGMGPSVFTADIDIDSGAGEEFSEFGDDIGVDLRAGAAWYLNPHLALLAEYRFTSVSIEFEEERCAAFLCFLGGHATSRTAEVTLETHHFLLGLSYHF